MSEWKTYKIKEFAEVVGGGTPNTTISVYWNGNISWITPRDLTGYRKTYISSGERKITEVGLKNSSSKLLPRGSVLITSRAPIGYVAIAEQEVCTNQGFKSLIINEKIANNLFIYYWVVNNTDFLNQMGTGTTFAEISGSVVKEIEIVLPPHEEQKAIASVLSSLDDKIDLLNRQNETLEKMAETLFRKWFVEPYKKYQSEGIITDEFQLETFLKWISETVGGEWGKEVMDNDFSKAAICLRGTDIADLNSGLAERAPLRFVKPKKFENIEPQNGDILIEISGGTETQSTGRTTYINDEVRSLFDYELVFSNFCRLIKIKDFRYSYFVYSYLQYLYKQDEFFNLENGSSGIKNLDYKTLLFDLKFPMPSEDLVINFHDTVEPLFKKINKNKLQIKSLSKLRDTLLPKLMSGEVRVKLD